MEDRYWFDNSLADEGNRLRLLEEIADPRSIRLLSELRVGEGWRCAELGAGGGSMARWLGDRVGETGFVTAVDRDVTLLSHLEHRENVELVETSIENWRVPSGSLDLIHTRNVLMHIDEADMIISRLVEALRPGGVLLLEEADYFPLAGMTSVAVMEVANALVANWTWARTMPHTISQLSVEDINVTIDTSMMRGGSAEAAFWSYTFRSVEERLTNVELAASSGVSSVTQESFDEALRLLADDTFWTPLAAVVCVSCRRTVAA
jgi:ubiquinone/menaquinone biosynthesis C-methylase UbiE